MLNNLKVVFTVGVCSPLGAASHTHQPRVLETGLVSGQEEAWPWCRAGSGAPREDGPPPGSLFPTPCLSHLCAHSEGHCVKRQAPLPAIMFRGARYSRFRPTHS